MMAMVDKASLGWHLIPSWSQAPRDTDEMQILPSSFVPGKWDVICHCGRESQDHVGNRRFNVCIKNHLKSYSEATSRPERSAIITNIVSSIREAAEAGFVRMDATTGHWYEVGDKMARDKVGQALRDALNSSSRSKKPPVERKRKRPSLQTTKQANSKPAAGTPDSSKQTDKKDTTAGFYPIHTVSIEIPLLLNPGFTETKIQANTQRKEPMMASKWMSGSQQGQGSCDKDMPSLDCKSKESSLKAPPTGQSDSKQSEESTESSHSPKYSGSDSSNQLSLIEWFEMDMQDAPP